MIERVKKCEESRVWWPLPAQEYKQFWHCPCTHCIWNNFDQLCCEQLSARSWVLRLPFPLWAWTFIETTWASERLPWRPPSTGPVWNSMSLTPDMSWLRGFHGSIRSHSTYLCHFVPMLQKRVSRLYRQFPCISETHVMNFGTMCVCVASGKRVEYGNGKHSRKVFRPPAACSSHVLYLGQHPSLVSQCVTEIHNISRCQLRWTRWNGDVESCQAFNLLYNIIQPYSGQFLQGPQRGT